MTRGALLAAAPLLVALPFVGAGPRNGDVVGYLWQARAGELWDRATHAGYVLLATPAVAAVPREAAPLALDLISWAACVGAALVVGRGRPLVGVAVAVALLPIAPFAEVDAPMWALLAAAWVSGPGLAGALVAAAVAVSPAALLAVPWLVASRRTSAGAVLAGAALAVLVLSVASGGDWWVGERGVLRSDLGSVGRTPAAWLAGLPWAWLPAVVVGWRREDLLGLVATAPLLLLPADVPGVVGVGLWAAPVVARAPAGLVAASLVAQGAWTTTALAGERGRIAAENERIEAAAATLAEEDGLVAPFSVAARVAYARTGDPYGWPWHPPGGWLRDQRERWCATPPARVWRWEDGLVELPASSVAEGCP